MKQISTILFLFAAFSVGAFAQVKPPPPVVYPGVSKTQMATLRGINRTAPIVLPTWIPSGFKLEKVHSKLGRNVKVYDRELAIIYSSALPNGKRQRFALEAGFDGLGDLMYDETKIIRSSVGDIYLIYEPFDPDENKKLDNYVMTEWFDVGNLAWHYVGMFGFDDGDPDMEMISLADTEKILKSLKRL